MPPPSSTRTHRAVTRHDLAAGGEGEAQRHFCNLGRKSGSAREYPDASGETELIIQSRWEAAADVDDGLKLTGLSERTSVWPSRANHRNRLTQSLVGRFAAHLLVTTPDNLHGVVEAHQVHGREDFLHPAWIRIDKHTRFVNHAHASPWSTGYPAQRNTRARPADDDVTATHWRGQLDNARVSCLLSRWFTRGESGYGGYARSSRGSSVHGPT